MNFFAADFLASRMLQVCENEIDLNDLEQLTKNAVDFVSKSTAITNMSNQKCQHSISLRTIVQETFSFSHFDASACLCTKKRE